ncbi:hypothetical protein DFR67_106225 [Williamsia limnetica]|jgi:hypothetical protein|uniref:Deazaflavin-dependent oxidoreductase (Nitroreductase family) n=1 Tax=Williamsia limnetica TaxID=882452 RepID=A0A318RJ33_WILLI|nr:hypothetical protein [Williamsia limnetica]PYE17522.1 hypothetical protein DFR67_106225 [Williamsia limnetica]
MNTFQKFAAVVNTGVGVIARIPVLDKIIGKTIATITYTGRKSGKTFSIPVAYKRSGDEVIIGVAMADKKTWWRNFSGDGAPISIELDGVERAGHGVSRRNDQGQVSVKVTLTPLV